MNRDSLYQKISEELERVSDGNAFQACAVALLQEVHPNLAPLPGGDDAGMDGALGTPEGAFPLVCTIQDDVLGNLRQNIQTYLSKRNGPKRAIVATSKTLTNRKKRNLESKAEELGVTLVNIYDAPYFVNRLYRDTKWRLSLLGIVGDPPALSVLPRRGRFAQSNLLIGREDEITWIKEVGADALLVGQPGSGKTYLHQHLANQNACLFAVDDSMARLADAIREQRPSIIVVDDAHIDLKLVEDLKRLRAELGAEFHLHVNCWPRHESVVQRVLEIPNHRVRRLQPLKRQQIFDLVKALGIDGPDWLLHMLISQSDGKPGLAAALAEICKSEDIGHIWSGEAAARQLLGDLRLVKDETDRCVLAAFALGGDAGMSFGSVSNALELSQTDLRRMTAGLGAGGLVEEVAEDRLQVRPPAIRPVLVRDVFFSDADSLSSDQLLGTVSNPHSAACTAEVLLGARQRGANIANSLLEDFVVMANKHDSWEHFGWVDEGCAELILNKHPKQICHAAPGVLNFWPVQALHALLDADENKVVPTEGAVEHPRRRISEWLFPIDELGRGTIERRKTLLDVLEQRVRKNKVGVGDTFTWALAECLQATFQGTRQSPGNRRQFQIIKGVASQSALVGIIGLWPRVKELILVIPNASARILFDEIENWCLPQRLQLSGPLSDEDFELVKRHGATMLSTFVEMPNCNRAWRTRAASIAKWGELELKIDVDPLFDAIFSDRDHSENWEAEHAKRIKELHGITNDLLSRDRDDVVQMLDQLKAESAEFGSRNENGYLWVVYQYIADNDDSPEEWIDLLVAKGTALGFVSQFVDRLSQLDDERYARLLGDLLRIDVYQSLAINRILRMATPNRELLSAAFANLDNAKNIDELWLSNPGISLAVMQRLLDHSNPTVRGEAVIGEWQREPTGTIREEIKAKWQAAVRDVHPDHYALRDILKADPTLAFEWLGSQLANGREYFSVRDQSFNAACDVLNKNQRCQLLRLLSRENYTDDIFDRLLGDHIDLFGAWLEFQSDVYLRLRPLDRHVGPRWEKMALIALEAGVSSDDLIRHCTPNHFGGMGPLSYHFAKHLPAYESLANHPDVRLRPAGHRGLSWIRSNLEREQDRERREEDCAD